MEKQLEDASTRRAEEARSVRNVDRTVRDLEQQISRREKQNTQLQEDVSKGRDKISALLNTIDELQSSDSQAQLATKRADRELREEREKALRLERELEGWKGLRMERGSSLHRSGTMLALGQLSEGLGVTRRRVSSRKTSGRGAPKSVKIEEEAETDTAVEGLTRKESTTKGFL